MENQEEKIQFIERNQEKLTQVNCSVKHTFAPGICMREVLVPAGSYIIGHYHNTIHTNFCMKGSLFLQRDDRSFEYIKAPYKYISGTGRKVMHVIEEMIWINVFPTDSQDVDWIENHFLDKTEAWIEGSEKAMDLRLPVDRKTRLEYSVEHSFKIKNNTIVATGDIKKNDIIGQLIINGELTILALNIKFSNSPNSAVMGNNLVAIKDIHGYIGGLDGEEITIGLKL